MELVETILYTEDIEALRDFYMGLGAVLLLDNPRFCQLELGAARLALLPAEYGDVPALSIRSEDLARDIGRITTAGGILQVPPDASGEEGAGVVAATLLDPDGNPLILWQPGAGKAS